MVLRKTLLVGGLLILTSSSCGASDHQTVPAPSPHGSGEPDGGVPAVTTSPQAAAERVYDVTKDGEVILIVNSVPGSLIDTTAGVPPPGWTPPEHPFLSARCVRDAVLCSQLGELLRESSSIDEFFERLRAAGFVVQQVDSSRW